MDEERDIAKTAVVVKNYNLQRSGSIIDADFLMHENPKVVGEIECKLMAITYEDIGNYDKAEYYWNECISKSEGETSKHINLSDYATFLFNQNRIGEGRNKFNEAQKLTLDNRDDHLYLKADTYLTNAILERTFNFETESKDLIKLSKDNCEKIINKNKRHIMKKQIETSLEKISKLKTNSEEKYVISSNFK